MALYFLIFERHGAAAPAFDVMVGMARRPFRQLRLRAHQTLYRGNLRKDQAAFATVIYCRRQTGDKQKLNHGSGFPIFIFCSYARLEHRLKSVKIALIKHSKGLSGTICRIIERIFGAMGRLPT
ncbi:hypothetical protein [Roseobacter weihaiensis]|uniref:hypothetical protein n=1 Tax=Roseobacter weihaiensis TaxID=2763262 RepID=UPI001D0A582C|nr:hypothetical protein [Roseobacter sp. H9]